MTIGFFAPLPIALMIPFMVAQSLAMMEAAGKGWQFGKRKISAMSNKDFNKLTPHRILEDSLGEYKLMIPSMTQAFDESRLLQTKIIEVMVGYAVQLLSDIEKGLTAALGAHKHGELTTSIKNPFVSSFLTPAIIPPVPTEDLIPLTDQHIHDPSSVSDFEDFQKRTADEKANEERKQKLRDEAQARFENRQVKTVTKTFKKLTPRAAALKELALLERTVKVLRGQYQKQLSRVKNIKRALAVITSQTRAALKIRDKVQKAKFLKSISARSAVSSQDMKKAVDEANRILRLINTTQTFINRTRARIAKL